MMDEKWNESLKNWVDIEKVLADFSLASRPGYFYFGVSRENKDNYSIMVPGAGPYWITRDQGLVLADMIYEDHKKPTLSSMEAALQLSKMAAQALLVNDNELTPEYVKRQAEAIIRITSESQEGGE